MDRGPPPLPPFPASGHPLAAHNHRSAAAGAYGYAYSAPHHPLAAASAYYGHAAPHQPLAAAGAYYGHAAPHQPLAAAGAYYGHAAPHPPLAAAGAYYGHAAPHPPLAAASAYYGHAAPHQPLAAPGYGYPAQWRPVTAADQLLAVDAAPDAPGHRLATHPSTEDANAVSLGPFALIKEAEVETIWRDNSAKVFSEIRDKLAEPRSRLYIAIDLEYAASTSTDVRHRPISSIDWYNHLRQYVNCGIVVQMGLVFVFERPPGQPSSPVLAYEINFEVDIEGGEYNINSIAFLQQQGHDFEECRDKGVMPEWVFAGLLRHLPFSDESVTWVAFHGDRDIAFLLRLLQAGGRGVLPPDLSSFMHEMREKFPVYYDVRVIAQLVREGFSGKLSVLAGKEYLDVGRRGVEHFAGSNALLTMGCFSEIIRRSGQEGLVARRGLLAGIEELHLAIRCARHIDASDINIVRVNYDNFEEEAARIRELVVNNFSCIGLQVLVPASSTQCACSSVNGQDDYELMKGRLDGAGCFEVFIGFMNAQGYLGYGRIWRMEFNAEDVRVDAPGEHGAIHPRLFARMLASCAATHDTGAVWVTSYGADGIGCLIRSFMAPGDLPVSWEEYSCNTTTYFPATYDIGLLARSCPDIGYVRTGCKGKLRDIASALDLVPGPCDVITILRCFVVFRDRYKFCGVTPGTVMSRCCSTCPE